MQLFTIGGYGHSQESFHSALIGAGIDLFVDIRQRRGMRGKRYAFLNAKYLQSSLRATGISYVHMKDLAPPSQMRDLQKNADSATATTKRARQALSTDFISAYASDILDATTPHTIIERLTPFHKVCFFCVEAEPGACHRSIVADWLDADIGPARHL